MPRFIVIWLITTVSLMVTAYFVPGFHIQNFAAAVIAAAILGLVNAIVRPVLFLLTLPITILTLGLFSFVVNALTLWLASEFSRGFSIDGFVPALIGSLVMSVVSGLLHWVFSADE
jgi:putative membrane protein